MLLFNKHLNWNDRNMLWEYFVTIFIELFGLLWSGTDPLFDVCYSGIVCGDATGADAQGPFAVSWSTSVVAERNKSRAFVALFRMNHQEADARVADHSWPWTTTRKEAAYIEYNVLVVVLRGQPTTWTF